MILHCGVGRCWSGLQVARGVVLTASYEARPYGVGSAMPMARARRICPSAVIVPPRFDRYQEVSAKAWLTPLPISRLWGAGPKTQARLRDLGLHTIGDVANADRESLYAELGSAGIHFHALAQAQILAVCTENLIRICSAEGIA